MIGSIVYGPVPSRRLGRSLGINNIPPKACSYSCVYCQLGNTDNMLTERQTFYDPAELVENVTRKVEQVSETGETIDYLTFVPDGEPSLDANLGEEIGHLKSLNIRIAVITNASLIWREDVCQELKKADWVSLKVDTVNQETWHRLNRPRKSLQIERILEGMVRFASDFTGELATETMLIQGINDNAGEMERVADFLARLKPAKAYLAIPTRPPAEKTIIAADEQAVNLAYQVFGNRLNEVEYLIGYEGNAFSFSGNIEEELLSITSVHPMREEAVTELLKKAGSGWELVDKLIKDGNLVEVEYRENRFYMRKLQCQASTGT